MTRDDDRTTILLRKYLRHIGRRFYAIPITDYQFKLLDGAGEIRRDMSGRTWFEGQEVCVHSELPPEPHPDDRDHEATP